MAGRNSEQEKRKKQQKKEEGIVSPWAVSDPVGSVWTIRSSPGEAFCAYKAINNS